MLRVLGKARIQHADTGVVYKIDKDSLDFDFDEDREREIRRGAQIEYNAIFDHPQLGRLTWTVVEASFDSIEHHDYNVQNHILLKNFGFILSDEISDADGDEEDDEDRIAEMVEWFHENFEAPDDLPYDKEMGHLWLYGGPFDASYVLQENFPDEDYDIIEATVANIEGGAFNEWAPISGTKYFDDEEYRNKEPIIDDNLKDIEYALNALIDNAPKPKTAPAFALGDDNRFHITLPPDSQPVDSRDVSLKELRETIEALLKSRIWANTHPELTPIVEEYKEVISGEQVSISEVYWSGIKFDNAVQMIKETLPFNAKVDIKTAIDKHGAYIVLDEEGRRLVEASVVYRQSAEQAEVLKTAGEQLAKNVAENPDLFGKDVRDNFSDFSNDIGKGKYPERSNQSNVNKITNLFSSILRWMKSPKGTIMSVIFGGSVVTSTPGQMAIKAGASLINKAWVFLINTASSIKAFATQSPWLAEVVQLLEYIKPIIGL